MEVNSCPTRVFGRAEEWRGVKPKKNVWHFLLWTKVFLKNRAEEKKKKENTHIWKWLSIELLQWWRRSNREGLKRKGGDKRLSSQNTKEIQSRKTDHRLCRLLNASCTVASPFSRLQHLKSWSTFLCTLGRDENQRRAGCFWTKPTVCASSRGCCCVYRRTRLLSKRRIVALCQHVNDPHYLFGCYHGYKLEGFRHMGFSLSLSLSYPASLTRTPRCTRSQAWNTLRQQGRGEDSVWGFEVLFIRRLSTAGAERERLA